MIQGDLKTFVLLIFIIIAIIIVLNIIFRSIFVYMLFNKLKNTGNYSTPHIIIIITVIIAIYLLMYFISKQTIHKSQTRSRD